MPDYQSSSAVTDISDPGVVNIDALTQGTKWGGPLGRSVALSYSFPWTVNATAQWYYAPATEYGPGGYGTENEPAAQFHFGLNATQVAAARTALQAWANVANVIP